MALPSVRHTALSGVVLQTSLSTIPPSKRVLIDETLPWPYIPRPSAKGLQAMPISLQAVVSRGEPPTEGT